MRSRRNDIRTLAKLIETAKGEIPPDLVIGNARVINVFTGEILPGNVAIYAGRIAGVGDYSGPDEIDAKGRFLAPGLIDSHMHLESSLLSPWEFARAVSTHGTTTVVIDPHEIANVSGAEGIEEILSKSDELPVQFYVMASSCVPASDMETSGAVLDAGGIKKLYRKSHVLGLAEVMDFRGVLQGAPGILEKLRASTGRPIDGHAPGVIGKDLQAYCAAGMQSDHETISVDEGREKLRAGMYLMLRQGSAARNLEDLSVLIDSRTINRFLLVTDDLLPTDIMRFGHIDHLLRMLVARGIDPVDALRMGTINAAERFNLERIGAVAPGYRADIVLFDDLTSFNASLVISAGQVVSQNGEMVLSLPERRFSQALTDSIHIESFESGMLAIPASGELCRVMVAQDGQLTTPAITERPAVMGGRIVSDTARDILKIAVVERHKRSGNVGLGLISGFGLKQGAIASSVAHDAHNIIVVGTSDQDMVLAVKEIERLNGGLVAVSQGKVTAELALPVAGLVSDKPYEKVSRDLDKLDKAAGEMGSTMAHPFMTLSFMALEVIPVLKITDRGLVDVSKAKFIDLFTDGESASSSYAV